MWVRVGGLALAWLVLVSVVHWRVNYDHGTREVVRMGYMPVITNLAAPILDAATLDGDGVRLEALKFSSFADMGEALRGGRIDVAFMIAPLAVVLHQQGGGVRVVYIGNRHESTLVGSRDKGMASIEDLAGKTVAVPMRYSGHNLSVRRILDQAGLAGRVNIVEMNPPDMAPAMAAGALDAYCVGEPFAARAVLGGYARVIHYVEDVWPGFICNLVLVREGMVENRSGLVAMLVRGAARSGVWAKRNPEKAARIAARYWNQPVEVVKYAMNTPEDRIVYDRFVPKQEELREMAQLMVRFGLTGSADVDGLVDDRFARGADLSGVDGLDSILAGGTEGLSAEGP